MKKGIDLEKDLKDLHSQFRENVLNYKILLKNNNNLEEKIKEIENKNSKNEELNYDPSFCKKCK